jgi:hypothetical protein
MQKMSPGMRVVLLAIGALVVVGALAYFFLFRGSSDSASRAEQARQRALAVQLAGKPPIEIPDVVGEVFVTAKEDLDRAGLAWEVVGPVRGFHTNYVASQSPAAGTRVLNTGAPLVDLTLRKNPGQPQHGEPEQHSLEPGTLIKLYTGPASGVTTSTPAPTTTAVAPTTSTRRATTTAPRTTTTTARPATTTTAAPTPKFTTTVSTSPQTPVRPPAFVIPGAKKELVGELPLPRRAALLLRYVSKHRKPTDKVVKHWLVQHAWIVAGARFGWWHGEQALLTLIRVDHQVERQWKIGYKSERVAQRALAFVRAHEAKR